MPAEIFKVIASFEDEKGEPLSGADYSVMLMDKDRVFDDRLGASRLDAEGKAEFLIYTADILSIDSPGERTPDIYFVVLKNGNEICRTEVSPNVNFDAVDPVTGRADALTREFGPFRVPA